MQARGWGRQGGRVGWQRGHLRGRALVHRRTRLRLPTSPCVHRCRRGTATRSCMMMSASAPRAASPRACEHTAAAQRRAWMAARGAASGAQAASAPASRRLHFAAAAAAGPAPLTPTAQLTPTPTPRLAPAPPPSCSNSAGPGGQLPVVAVDLHGLHVGEALQMVGSGVRNLPEVGVQVAGWALVPGWLAGWLGRADGCGASRRDSGLERKQARRSIACRTCLLRSVLPSLPPHLSCARPPSTHPPTHHSTVHPGRPGGALYHGKGAAQRRRRRAHQAQGALGRRAAVGVPAAACCCLLLLAPRLPSTCLAAHALILCSSCAHPPTPPLQVVELLGQLGVPFREGPGWVEATLKPELH